MAKIHCPRCSYTLPFFDFDGDRKREIMSCLDNAHHLKAIQLIRVKTNCDLRDAKAFVTHFNHPYGHCHRCSNTQLAGEYIICPKCNTLNINWGKGG